MNSSAANLDRTAFTFSRMLEYFSIKELQAQTGQPQHNFPVVVVKELIDNALDECEYSSVKPKIGLSFTEGCDCFEIRINDNGRGITPEVVTKILDFNTRTTTKAFYRTPTRGQLGNALKTVVGIPYALSKANAEVATRYPITIESCGMIHIINVDEYAGLPKITHESHESNVEGTTIRMKLPAVVKRDYYSGNPIPNCLTTQIEQLHKGFAIFNPHARFCYDYNTEEEKTDSSYDAIADESWRKFYPSDLPSPHWFDADALKDLINAHINSGAKKPFGTFVREFRGLSASGKAKIINRMFPDVKTIEDLHDNEISDLLAAMQKETKPPSPSVLGIIGADNLRQRLSELHTIEEFWYKKIAAESEGLPFVVEAAAARTAEDNGRMIYTGLNFAPAYDDPFKDAFFNVTAANNVLLRGSGLDGLLYALKVNKSDNFVFVLHVTSPVFAIRDRAKSTIFPSDELKTAIAEAAYACCKKWYNHKKREERDAAKEEQRQQRESEERAKEERKNEWSIKEAVFEVLPAAIAKASSDGEYRFSVRSLFYQVRPLIQEYTQKELDYGYFGQTLINEHEEEHGEIRGLYRDPRGYFLEPHTNEKIPLGTINVERYQPPSHLFNKILYIEKKGLLPIIEDAQLHKRYDIGIIAAEGYAVRAAKDLISKVLKNAKEDITVLCLHDCDIDGLMIANTLRRETPSRPDVRFEIIDLGLFIDSVEERGYERERVVRKLDMHEELKEQLTREEQRFLIETTQTSYNGKKTYQGWRVELNALTSAELISYIESKLVEHGITEKVCPPDEKIVSESEDIFDSDLRTGIEDKIKSLLDFDDLTTVIVKKLETEADFSEIPTKLKEELKDNPPRRWNDIITDYITEQTEEIVDNNTDVIHEIVKNSISDGGDSA